MCKVITLEAVVLVVLTMTIFSSGAAFGTPTRASVADYALNMQRDPLISSYSSPFVSTVVERDRHQLVVVEHRRGGIRCGLRHSHISMKAQEPSPPREGADREGAGVSRVLSRALGSILSKGQKFGTTSGSSVGSPGSSEAYAGKDREDGLQEQRWQRLFGDKARGGEGDDSEDVDQEDDEDDDGEDDSSGAAGGDGRPMWRNLGMKRSRKNANRLLRAKTSASAGIVVDGPFTTLEAYMNLPVSDYSLLDSSIIRRVSETTFRLQIPLKNLVNLDLTPTMEVQVENDPHMKSLVFRSLRSTLYGTVGAPGDGDEDVAAAAWSTPPPGKLEYFRVDFSANLRWARGDASMDPPRRGPRGRGFAGEVARRPRPTPPSSQASVSPSLLPYPSSDATERSASFGGAMSSWGTSVLASTGNSRPVDSSVTSLAAAAHGATTGVVSAAAREANLRIDRGTIFCETDVRVQVLLPPPYNTLLPWRLVRAVLGKVISTTVAYVLPRFLELLADDFYGWQSGTRRAAATANETDRTLLRSKGTPPVSTKNDSNRRGRTGSVFPGGRGVRGVTDVGDRHNLKGIRMGGVNRLKNIRIPGSRASGDRGRNETENGKLGTDGHSEVERDNVAAMDALYEWASEDLGTASTLSSEIEESGSVAEEDGEDTAEDGEGAQYDGPAWLRRIPKGSRYGGSNDSGGPRPINWWG